MNWVLHSGCGVLVCWFLSGCIILDKLLNLFEFLFPSPNYEEVGKRESSPRDKVLTPHFPSHCCGIQHTSSKEGLSLVAVPCPLWISLPPHVCWFKWGPAAGSEGEGGMVPRKDLKVGGSLSPLNTVLFRPPWQSMGPIPDSSAQGSFLTQLPGDSHLSPYSPAPSCVEDTCTE